MHRSQFFTPTQVSLIALGPLTNLALAVKLDPMLPQKLKDLYIMGGNMEGTNRNPEAQIMSSGPSLSL